MRLTRSGSSEFEARGIEELRQGAGGGAAEQRKPCRILGLDYGSVIIGIALSDELGITAQGLPYLRRSDLGADIDYLAAIVREHGVSRVVVGLPLKMDGSVGPKAREVMEFVEVLRGRLPLPVVTWDERLTTRAAERALREQGARRRKRKRMVDTVAAQLILQSYLDSLEERPWGT